MIEVRPRLCVVDGVLNLWIDRIDRENRVFETLEKDGTWRKVGLFEQNEHGAFVISPSATSDIIQKITDKT